jgi:4-hydroxy-3-polyprenylbenzoate decarboxylase
LNVKVVVGIGGASGVIYGVSLMQVLKAEILLVVSKTAKDILRYETDLAIESVYQMADEVFEDEDLFAPIASGSNRFDAMVIVPCSESTIAKIANGISDTLITRAAAVCLKEHRRLVIVPRETPVSAIMLENELKLARLGVAVVPASPGFYPKPKTVQEMVDFIVGRILDQLGQPNEMFDRWS